MFAPEWPFRATRSGRTARVSAIMADQLSASTTKPGTSGLVASQTFASLAHRASILISCAMGEIIGSPVAGVNRRPPHAGIGAEPVRAFGAAQIGKRVREPDRDAELHPVEPARENLVRRTDAIHDPGALPEPRDQDQARADQGPAPGPAEVVEALPVEGEPGHEQRHLHEGAHGVARSGRDPPGPGQEPGHGVGRDHDRDEERRRAEPALTLEPAVEGEEDVGRAHAQSRRSSLMLVLARVCASTRLTITAQDSEGPGEPSGRSLPGKVPGTTTE